MKSRLFISAFLSMFVIFETIALGAPPAATASSPAAGKSGAASLSELLEKGIYTEETVGDVDAAMKIYEQVLAEARSASKPAAQAQYRLALCLLKKKKEVEAQTAFEKLIKDYPEEKDLIARARKHVPGEPELGPVPWVDGEVLPLVIKLGGGLEIGTFTYTANAAKAGKQDAWQLQIRRFVLAGMNNQGISRVNVDRKTFQPLTSLFKHTILGQVEARYRSNEVEITTKTDGKVKTKKMELNGPVYDNEQVIHLMRQLPLAVGYKTNIPVFVTFGTGHLPVGLEVPAVETVKVPAGTFECFKVELSIKQTFWYSNDSHRYIVKFEAEGVTAELAGIRQAKPGEPNKFHDENLVITLTAPAGWNFYKPNKKNDDGEDMIFLIDPEANSTNMIVMEPLSGLKTEEKKSVRAWAESEVSHGEGVFKDFKVRSDSWREHTVLEYGAASALADFTDGEAKVAYSVFIFADTRAIAFKTIAPRDDFDAHKKVFDGIIASAKINTTNSKAAN